MTAAEQTFDELDKKWKSAKAVTLKTLKSYQEARAAYDWTAHDPAKWQHLMALGDKHTAALEEQNAAFEALTAFQRKRVMAS